MNYISYITYTPYEDKRLNAISLESGNASFEGDNRTVRALLATEREVDSNTMLTFMITYLLREGAYISKVSKSVDIQGKCLLNPIKFFDQLKELTNDTETWVSITGILRIK